ncbi:class I SAM-dependent methyltransferase [Phytohabitans rumicis]|uniref:Methyltransferase n=1 Tax=Phytohabitans rumicis TaxID=1076125 RepID=A0A6V8L9X3_9ACTN|nr:class I SAM-dependent methyltransferase [Phytohabitans rumicis]GFJ91808.1 methyltransferase [Phytohabitans rumicis]
MKTGYSFDNRAPEADSQLRTLESFLDPITTARLAYPVLRRGAACWEVGAGGGSVARVMAAAVGPEGHVVASDLDPSHIEPDDNLSVVCHDARTDAAPSGAPFDVIHARLLLLHLPERRKVLRDLVDALAPGGWLVVEEFDCTAPLRVLTAPTDDAAKLFGQVMDVILGALQDRGADLAWAQDVHTEMVAAGLSEVDTVTHSESWTGGEPGAALHDLNSRTLEPRLVAAGLSVDQLTAFRKLAHDPSFASLSYQFVSTRGRKPLR